MSSSDLASPELGRNLTFGLLDRLGSQIVTGVFAGRPFPTEADISAAHGVSRSVTREAIKMLAAKGMLSARPRQGITLRPEADWNLLDPAVLGWLLQRKVSIDLLVQFNQLRAAIEPAAAALAAVSASAAGLAEIERGFARMVAADGGRDDGLDADIAFHLAVLRASGNPFFMQFRELVSTALRTSIRFTNRIVGRSADLEAHGAVREAIGRRDPAAARAAMAAIIGDVMEVISGHTELAAD
ncbi:FadR/GntR family transcriptional regulator [Novosphingobium piscinae]|uniref:FadR family transcriptional regulator n=1 Tax=Novosphingobium piscinae TaxID=1507448 RepID=A0A7X1KRH5_9SPHN|nr:FCD domain-containing protein [Novosphingobium piscinae]MBC2670620.1 FadR family transcriptional regulator [Novosphingobium piscinae]